MRILFFTLCVLFCNNIGTMEQGRSIMPSDWAYVLLRGCKKCGVEKPLIPQIKTVSLSVKNKSDLDLFFNDPINKSLYCPHSGLGLYKALSSFDGKENKKTCDDAVEDTPLYKVVFDKNCYIPGYNKIKKNPWLNVKKCLFTGGDLLTANIRHDKSIAQKLYDFFSVAEQNQFDFYNVISKRWSEEFIADIYQAAADDYLDEESSIDACTIMSSILDFDDTLLSFAVSHDGLTSAISLNRSQSGLFLLKNKEPEVLMLGDCFYPVIKTVFSKNSAVLVTVSSGLLNNCTVWDVKTGKEEAIMFCAQDNVSAVAVSDDGSLVALFGRTGDGVFKTLNLWNSKGGVFIASIDNVSMPDLVSLEFSADKKWLFGRARHELDCVFLWKVDIQNKKLIPVTEYGALSACAFASSGNLVAFADYEGDIYVLDTYENSERIKIKEFFGGTVRVIVFDTYNPNNIFLARVYGNGVVYSVWNFIAKIKKDFFFIPSLNNASAKEFTSITLSEGFPSKLLLGSSNAFVLGDWIRK